MMTAELLDKHIWPQIQHMLSLDAYFKLTVRARELAGGHDGIVAELIESGYVISQTIAVRKLCDNRRDVFSLRRLLVDENTNKQMDDLLQRLDSGCGHVCSLVNDYVAHTANHLRRKNIAEWNLQVGHLIEAQKAICQVAVIFDRDRLKRKNYVGLIPVEHFDMEQEFKGWVGEEHIQQLWDFLHEHHKEVNAWIPGSEVS